MTAILSQSSTLKPHLFFMFVCLGINPSSIFLLRQLDLLASFHCPNLEYDILWTRACPAPSIVSAINIDLTFCHACVHCQQIQSIITTTALDMLKTHRPNLIQFSLFFAATVQARGSLVSARIQDPANIDTQIASVRQSSRLSYASSSCIGLSTPFCFLLFFLHSRSPLMFLLYCHPELVCFSQLLHFHKSTVHTNKE